MKPYTCLVQACIPIFHPFSRIFSNIIRNINLSKFDQFRPDYSDLQNLFSRNTHIHIEINTHIHAHIFIYMYVCINLHFFNTQIIFRSFLSPSSSRSIHLLNIPNSGLRNLIILADIREYSQCEGVHNHPRPRACMRIGACSCRYVPWAIAQDSRECWH